MLWLLGRLRDKVYASQNKLRKLPNLNKLLHPDLMFETYVFHVMVHDALVRYGCFNGHLLAVPGAESESGHQPNVKTRFVVRPDPDVSVQIESERL